jgi:flagellar biosynthesis/type III secretory pathway M-ring protein FliF/YscJ
MEFLIVLAVLCVVVLFVSWPLRQLSLRPAERQTDAQPSSPDQELAELEAAREAKYREIRDAELDFRTGKLSQADYEAIDRTLRTQAAEILRALDRLTGMASSYHRG